MQEIKCPKCGEVFKIDESNYNSIVKQIRDHEFTEELSRREKQFKEEINKAIELTKSQTENASLQELNNRELKIKELEANFKGPENMKEKILEGQVKKAFSDKVLLNQPYILDDSKTVEQFIKEAIAKTGENITIRQFKRIELGVTE